jgi:uncharacterized protein YuzE
VQLYISYDEQADLLAISFREGAANAHARDFGGGRFLESDDDGPVGVEFLRASEGVDLSDIPHADQIERALRSLHALTGRVRRHSPA